MKALFAIAGIMGITLLNGWVVINMWNWYVLPLGAPEISFAHALGLATLVSFIARATIIDEDGEEMKRLVYTIASPLLTIMMGWIIKFWM